MLPLSAATKRPGLALAAIHAPAQGVKVEVASQREDDAISDLGAQPHQATKVLARPMAAYLDQYVRHRFEIAAAHNTLTFPRL